MNDDRPPRHPATGGSSRPSDRELETVDLGKLLNSIPQMIWTTGPDGDHEFLNQRWYEFTGATVAGGVSGGWADRIHPEDQFDAGQEWSRCLKTGEPFDTQLRLRDGAGVYHWVLARSLPVRDQGGAVAGWQGTFTDISALKAREDQLDLLANELSHRIKNVFAVVSGIISLSSREWPQAAPFAETVLDRIGALARAHEYVRSSGATPEPAGSQPLHGLIHALMEAYNNAARTRVTTGGVDVEVGIKAATALALVLHELATNAAKYGAFSTSGGTVDIVVDRLDDDLLIRWRERGGPSVPGPPSIRGFGTAMANRVATAQLDAKISTCWRAAGVEVAIRMPIERLSR